MQFSSSAFLLTLALCLPEHPGAGSNGNQRPVSKVKMTTRGQFLQQSEQKKGANSNGNQRPVSKVPMTTTHYRASSNSNQSRKRGQFRWQPKANVIQISDPIFSVEVKHFLYCFLCFYFTILSNVGQYCMSAFLLSRSWLNWGIKQLKNVLIPTPARHHSTVVHKACPYMVIVGSIQGWESAHSLISLKSNERL